MREWLGFVLFALVAARSASDDKGLVTIETTTPAPSFASEVVEPTATALPATSTSTATTAPVPATATPTPGATRTPLPLTPTATQLTSTPTATTAHVSATATPTASATSTPLPPTPTAEPEASIRLERVFAGVAIERMTGMYQPPDGRWFITEQHGRIFVFPDRSDAAATVYLDLRDRVSTNSNEEGLLGFAFAPDFSSSGVFYVH